MVLLKNKNVQNIMALFIISVIWIVLLLCSGSIFSGYHYEDDHELLDLSKQLEKNNFITVFNNKIVKEVTIEHRFRFMYYFHRILEVRIFGFNLIAISIYVMLLAIITSYFLFLFAQNIGLSTCLSFLFSMFSLIGEQAAIWWRLGPNETIGIFLFSIALYFMSKGLNANGRIKILFNSLFIITMVLYSLTKENFFLVIPSILILIIYLDIKKNNLKIKDSLKANMYIIISISAFFIIYLLFIVLNIGVTWNGRGLTGFSYVKYFNRFVDLSRYNLYGFMLALSIIYLLKIFIIDRNKKILSDIFFILVFFGLYLLPQLMIFSGGIYERYLNPSVIGYSLVLILLFAIIKMNQKKDNSISQNILIISFLSGFSLSIFLFLFNIQDINVFVLNFIKIIKHKEIHETWVAKINMILIKSIIFFLASGIISVLYNKFVKMRKNINRQELLLYTGLLIFLSFNVYDTFFQVKDYALRGRETTMFLSKLLELTKEKSVIVVATEPSENYEAGYSIKSYLNNISNRTNLYISPVSVYNDEQVEKNYGLNWYENGNINNIVDKSKIDCIAILLTPPPYESIEQVFIKKNSVWFDPTGFKRVKIGSNVLYSKK